MIDQRGILRWSTVPGFQSVDLSDREHFRVHAEGRRQPFISLPLVGRASGRWSIQLTRPIRDAADEFRGVVVVSLDPVAISAAMAALTRGTEGVATLLRTDAHVLARGRDAADLLGQRAGERVIALSAEAGEGFLRARSGLTGREVGVAWRRVEEWPLLVTHAVDRETMAEELRQRRLWLGGLLALAALMLAGTLALLMLVRARLRARAEAGQARRAREEMEEVIAGLPGMTYQLWLRPDGLAVRLKAAAGLEALAGVDGGGLDLAGWDARLDWEDGWPRARFHAVLLRDGRAEAEYRLRLADGRHAWMRDQARVLRRDEAGNLVVAGLLTDITQEREAAAQALASAKLATLGEVASGIAHEMNQPAAAIALAADIAAIELERGGAAGLGSALARLEEIGAQTGRMREIIEHLRLFSRSEAEGLPAEAVDIAGVVRAASTITGATLRAGGVELVAEVPPGLPRAWARDIPLEQVVINLLVNARDAICAAGAGGRVTVRAAAAGGAVMLTIADTGPGFAPHCLARAFEPFFTTKAPGKGTGLGLSIAATTIRRFGGTIEARNGAAGGAEVEIRLRAAGAGPSLEEDPACTLSHA